MIKLPSYDAIVLYLLTVRSSYAMIKRPMTIEETAHETGLSVEQIDRMVEAGDIPSFFTPDGTQKVFAQDVIVALTEPHIIQKYFKWAPPKNPSLN